MERSGVFPSHSYAQMWLYFDQRVVFGQPRARLRIVHEYSLTLFVSDTKSPFPLSQVDFAARGNLRSHLTRTLLQWVFRLNVLSLAWPEFWKLRDSTVDDMLTYSLKALHVGAYAVCHMTANIRLMSCSRSRVDEHVLFDIGCLASRRDRNGLSVATDMDDEAPDQDRSRRSRWFTAWPREVYHLGSREHCNRQGESCALVTFRCNKVA